MFDASILSAVNVATVDSFKLFKVFFAVTLSEDEITAVDNVSGFYLFISARCKTKHCKKYWYKFFHKLSPFKMPHI